MDSALPHLDLQKLRNRLLQIHEALENFKPLTARPPILDSSFDAANDSTEENQWLHQENVPGLKKLKENIKVDLDVLEKFLDEPNCAILSPLSTNAPYVIAVWNEVLCAPPPIVSVFKTFLLHPSTTTGDRSRKRTIQQHPPGAKVDVVADNGRRWIRINTIKNSRMLSEFREIDSYLTDSEEDSDEDWDDTERPSLAQAEFDNSMLRMGRSLLEAANANPVKGTTEVPRVTLRLTRLDPRQLNGDGTAPDPRIARTLVSLREMGIDVALGERTKAELPDVDSTNAPTSSTILPFVPTSNINLDLSVLIALISDLTHALLPETIGEANKRFVPPPEYREWKQKRQAMNDKPKRAQTTPTPRASGSESPGMEMDINDLPRDLIRHARALTNQLLQEMGKGLLQEMHDRISSSLPEGSASALSKAVFWTTSEARDRCLRIVSTIGGVHEKRRARALFCLDTTDSTQISLEEAERLYWRDSRFPLNFIPLLPIRIFSTSTNSATDIPSSFQPELHLQSPKSEFGLELSKVCTDILSQEVVPHPRALPEDLVANDSSLDNVHQADIQRASVTKANLRLTAHTVQSMRWGADLGWTTLTANRTSVKAILRELKAARVAGHFAGMDEPDEERERDNFAAIWIIDPRSLAEGMSSQPTKSQ